MPGRGTSSLDDRVGRQKMRAGGPGVDEDTGPTAGVGLAAEALTRLKQQGEWWKANHDDGGCVGKTSKGRNRSTQPGREWLPLWM